MRTNIRVAKVFGIPVEVNLTWLITLAFVTTMLALRFYPSVLPRQYRDDEVLHWLLALSSAGLFFLCILLHELAHSLVARRQGLEVKSITLFMFGGVSQITEEAKRPMEEFIMAIVGPLTSAALAGLFLAAWALLGSSESEPLHILLYWLFLMNLVLAIFNMAPGFPMDGGRVLRAAIWGASGNHYRATQFATFTGRSLGFGLAIIGGLGLLRILPDFVQPVNGAWLIFLGLFLESSSRQSWLQAKTLAMLSAYKASDLMTETLPTAERGDLVPYLQARAGRHYIFFVTEGQEDDVVGVLTEKEVETATPGDLRRLTAGDLMLGREATPTTAPQADGSSVLRQMEARGAWHLPVVDDGRVVGVISKESLLRIMAKHLIDSRRLQAQQ